MKKKQTNKVPRWVMAHANKCKQALGLWDWNIKIMLQEKLEFDGKPAKGTHETTYSSLSSLLTFDALIAQPCNKEDGLSSITHEFIHVAFVEPDNMFHYALDFVPEEHREHCIAIYNEAKEHAVEKTARHLTPMLKAMKEIDE